MQNPIPKVAAVHDISGFGRSSLTIVLPVLASMGVQVCPLPTALLSTQTSGFENYYFLDLTASMKQIIAHWKTLDINFEAVYSGFLGSPEQAAIVAELITFFSPPMVVVDPVLGDDGETYGPFDEKMVVGMRELVKKADIITPNFTEAALLLEEEYRAAISLETCKEWMVRLAEMGPSQVIITSVNDLQQSHACKEAAEGSSVLAYNRIDGRFWKVACSYVPAYYPGTGDMLAGVITGSLLQGDSLPIALDRAVQFVSIAIRSTFGYSVPSREGALLERVLHQLHAPITVSTYEIV